MLSLVEEVPFVSPPTPPTQGQEPRNSSLCMFSRICQTAAELFEEIYRATSFLPEPEPAAEHNDLIDYSAITWPNDPSHEVIFRFLKEHKELCEKELTVTKKLAGHGKNSAHDAGLEFMAHLSGLGSEEIRKILPYYYRSSPLNPNKPEKKELSETERLFVAWQDKKKSYGRYCNMVQHVEMKIAGLECAQKKQTELFADFAEEVRKLSERRNEVVGEVF